MTACGICADRMPAGKATKKKQTVQLQSKSKMSMSGEPATQSVHDITVRECLMWPVGDEKALPNSEDYSDVVYVSLRQQQQQTEPMTQVCEVGLSVKSLPPVSS